MGLTQLSDSPLYPAALRASGNLSALLSLERLAVTQARLAWRISEQRQHGVQRLVDQSRAVSGQNAASQGEAIVGQIGGDGHWRGATPVERAHQASLTDARQRAGLVVDRAEHGARLRIIGTAFAGKRALPDRVAIFSQFLQSERECNSLVRRSEQHAHRCSFPTHLPDAAFPTEANHARLRENDGRVFAVLRVQFAKSRVQVAAYRGELEVRVAPFQLGDTSDGRGTHHASRRESR